jgi:tRNA(Ile)-lysidine synthase
MSDATSAPATAPVEDLAEACGPLLARCRFPAPGTAVTCAVSGGSDSLSLLALAVAAGCRATAVHVDHGLRPGSADEAGAVAEMAARLGASFRSERVQVDPGPNLEARARAARHGVLPDDVLFGHTADDQAETVLLNLLRGAGLDGLAGIRADGRHPILALRRDETRALCARLGLSPLDDPSNRDPRHRRNRVRAEVLPLLDEVAERDLVPVLARQAELLREVADLLVSQAELIDPTDAHKLAAAPAALARVVVRTWLRSCDRDQHPPDAATVDRVLSVARGDAVATDVGGGWRVARSRGRLRLEPPR